jgi:hypothetical protein
MEFLCHSILAWDSPTPYAFLEPSDVQDPERDLHEWLRGEFLKRK